MKSHTSSEHLSEELLRCCSCGSTHSFEEEAWRCQVSQVCDGLWVCGEPTQRVDNKTLINGVPSGVDLVINLAEIEPETPHASSIEVLWMPATDDGSRRNEGWFEDICAASEGRNVLMQSHLGVARAPSAAYAVLLSRGVDECSALELVMRRRPVATTTYASEAYEWFFQEQGTAEQVSYLELLRQRLIKENRARLSS